MQPDEIVKGYSRSMDNVLLILHALQTRNPQHYLTEEDLARVAEHLNVSYSRIYGIATYYTLFSLKPRGRHIIRVCRSPVCQMLGSDRIFDQIKRMLQRNFAGTNIDSPFTLEPTECIGQCDRAPCLSVDHTVYRITKVKKIEEILSAYRKHP